MAALPLLAGAGCSRHDDAPVTPVLRAATPTYQSTVRSTELYTAPYYTQPGIRNGAPVTLPPSPVYRNFEPNDPLSQSVYAALAADGHVPTHYLTSRARDGVVILEGTVGTAAQKQRAESVARAVPGVRELRSALKVTPPATTARL
jgi:hypothetical protein